MWGEVCSVDGRMAYFLPGDFGSKSVFAYNSANNKWAELPKCPNYDISSLPLVGRHQTMKSLTHSSASLIISGQNSFLPCQPSTG